jgi:hypothetical protein
VALDGYELAKKIIFSNNDFSCDKLIEVAGSHETEWLEFKSSLYPVPDSLLPDEHVKRKEKDNDYDYFWHVAKAVISIANTKGGVVLLGVSDDLKPVDIACSDPKGHLDND